MSETAALKASPASPGRKVLALLAGLGGPSLGPATGQFVYLRFIDPAASPEALLAAGLAGVAVGAVFGVGGALLLLRRTPSDN